MKPISTSLLDGKFVGEGFTRLDAWKADTRHTVLIKRKDQAVPVNGSHLIQVVGHVDLDVFAFLEAHHRPGRCTVITDAVFHEIAGVNFDPINREIIFASHDRCRHQQA